MAVPQTAMVPQLETEMWDSQLALLAQKLKWSGLGGRLPVVSVVEKLLPVPRSLVQGLAVILDPVVAVPQTALGPQLETDVWESQLAPLAQGLKWSGLGGRPAVVSVRWKGMPVQ